MHLPRHGDMTTHKVLLKSKGSAFDTNLAVLGQKLPLLRMTAFAEISRSLIFLVTGSFRPKADMFPRVDSLLLQGSS